MRLFGGPFLWHASDLAHSTLRKQSEFVRLFQTKSLSYFICDLSLVGLGVRAVSLLEHKRFRGGAGQT